MSRIFLLNIFLTLLFIFPLHGQQLVSSHIYFDTDVYALSKKQKPLIHSFFQDIPDTIQLNIRVIGYADYRGSQAYNDRLSYDRARSVSDYIKSLYPDRIHRLNCMGEGELPRQLHVPLRKQRTVSIEVFVFRTRTLQDLEEGRVESMDEVVLDDLNFKPGRHFLLERSVPKLREIERILKIRTDLIIEIAGHVCCVGDFTKDGFDHDTKTHNLSSNRAKNIYEYLVRKGIDSARMEHKGYGFSQPKAYPELEDSDRDQNRRVEIRIIGKLKR